MNFCGRLKSVRTFTGLLSAGLFPLAIMIAPLCSDPAWAAERLEILEGDHICILGDGLPDAMQHTGWLETLLNSRFHTSQLVIRNLGYNGDEVELSKRLRSADFGTPDQWLSGSAPIPNPQALATKEFVRENRFELTGTKADVIFAFFGSNESHAGQAGLEAFQKNIDQFIEHTLSQKYDGVESPRLVLFSPIAHENLERPHWPDGKKHNENLSLYTQAMAEAVKGKKVVFVDLFTPTMESYARIKQPLTHDGIHPNVDGDREISRIIDESLFGTHPVRNPQSLERLRTAVLDKNFHWFHRYRVTDGFSTYGGRAWLKFTDSQTNYEVAQRELDYLDVKTANRDRRIWATAATLSDPMAALPAVQDVGLPELIEVKTNKPGPLEGGKHEFLTAEAAIEKMTVHSGMKVELVATEEQFPELINPVQMAFDTKGRLWVAAWTTYPHWKPSEEMNDKLLILEDTNHDGRTDQVKTFAGDLHNPTGFEFWGGGVICAQGPDIWFLEDTDGDDLCDRRTRILGGIDTADTHHTANSFTLDPSGSLYFQEGTFHHSQTETPWGPPVRVTNGAVFRYEPRTGKFDLYSSYGFANPHGHTFDRWGEDIVVDGTGSVPYPGAVISTRLNGLDKHGGAPSVYKQRTRPCPAIETLSSPHFPAEMQGNLLVGNVITVHGLLRYTLDDTTSSIFEGTEQEPVFSSSDPNFRPSDFEMGPDGAIYFTDWQNPIIGHMQHNIRDPNRDRIHGRVYRVVMDGKPLEKPIPIAGEPVAALVHLLANPTDRVRHRAKIELSARPESQVVPAVRAWLAGLNPASEQYEHNRLEAFWMLRYFDQIDLPLLEVILTTKEPRARAAAMRVLSTIHDRVPDALDKVRRGAADEHPRVRLESVRAATYLSDPAAIEVLAIAEEFPSDSFLDYVKKESNRVLEPLYKSAKETKIQVVFKTDAGRKWLYRSMNNDALAMEPRSTLIYREMLLRPGLDERLRTEAIESLAKADHTTVVKVAVDALQTLDSQSGEVDAPTVFDLIRVLLGRPSGELSQLRDQMQNLAVSGKRSIMRRIGFVALTAIDGSGGADGSAKVWELASSKPEHLVDLISALPLVSDPGVRSSLYERIVPLLDGLPGVTPGQKSLGASTRFIRVNIPGKATLTLAEVAAFRGENNIARSGKASQKNTSHGGDASRAIDGNTNSSYGSGSQTHTEENTDNPWWEVDLGSEQSVDRIVISNRGDGLQDRLNNFTLTLLDAGRKEVFQVEKQSAPSLAVEISVVSDSDRMAGNVRRATFSAIVGVRGKEIDAFTRIAAFIKSGVDRDAAIVSLGKIPTVNWPADQAAGLLDVLIESMRKASTDERSSDAGLAAWQFAETLSTLLPAAEGKARRAILSDLGVRVVRIGTVYERMAYDKETIAVEAGKPVLFVLENADVMPHNFVIVKPGTMQHIGEMAEKSAQEREFAGRHFVPKSSDVLASSTLLQPQAMQKVQFHVPTEPGVYPYVCTYPGHWRRMFGAMYVVADLEGYLANPAAYLATHPLPIKDELLKDRRPRTEWAFLDLEAGVAAMEKGRSFVHGRELFRTASCISCHALGGVGTAFGAELAKLDAKMTPVEIMRHIIEPSLKIDEKYRSTTVITDDGNVITGIVTEDTPTEIAIVLNPVLKAEPIRIKKSGISERRESSISIMPKGLLDKLTRDEVLDLVAFVASRGSDSSALFSSAGCDHEAHAPPASKK